MERWSATWAGAHGLLRVFEPTAAEMAAAAPALCAHYNEPYNRSMLDHAEELSEADVLDHLESLQTGAGHPFLLEREGDLVGDGDLRNVDGRVAECAVLVGDRAVQGRGLGTRFGVMIHALAFGPFALERVYCSIIPSNLPSQRLFEKLGYLPDTSPEARAYVDEPTDLTYSLDRARFSQLHGSALADIQLARRDD